MHIEKNVLESILNTLLMNDKSKDTAKARQDLKSLGIPKKVAGSAKTKTGSARSLRLRILSHQRTEKSLKSHDCHIMMQRLLPYGLQQYLPPDVAKPLIELCLFFKQICSQTLMVDDMLKAQSKDVTTKFNRPGRNVDCPPPTEFPKKDMKEEFPGWFGKQIRQRHVDNNPGVNKSSELFALACGPSQTPISVNSCVVNGVRNNITQIKANGEAFKNDQYILTTQVKQCFYLEDMARRPLGWKVVEHVSHKKFLNGGVIVVEDDSDVIHVDNSSDLALSTSFNDLEIAALHIDGQSIDVDAPPDIIDVVDEDDDIIDEEDPIPHDLADSDDEDLVNLDIDDGVNVVYSSEEED
ncbi:hypothetical protein Tco_0484674 [Tanacetum coccineum]